MNRNAIFEEIKRKKSFLCVGLDTDLNLLPKHLLQEEDPIFAFNKQIIDATLPYTVSYKPNLAFYECLGAKGIESYEKTIAYLKQLTDNVFVIADAKRGDIGNTAKMYAKAFFERNNVDAVTIAPYMGKDSVTPFLEYKDKWAIVLALTSNESAEDFQMLQPQLPTLLDKLGIRSFYWKKLFEVVIMKSLEWGDADNIMFVAGATRPEYLENIRDIAPDNFLLVPGIGSQGGDLESVCKYGLNKQCGLIVNASRSILYASKELDFAEKAAIEAQKIQQQMENILRNKGLV